MALVPPAARGSRKPAKTQRREGDSDKGIAILLFDDNRLFRMGLSAMLRNQKGLRLLAASGDPERVLRLDRRPAPDVILLDLGLGERGSTAVVRNIRLAYPETRLIVMGILPLGSEILDYVKAGVSGFVLKDASIGDFVGTIRAVVAGVRVLPSSLTDSLFSQIVEDAARKGTVQPSDTRLTTRERDIVDLIVQGLSNKEIGQRLSIATDTVKSHVHNILEKLSLRSRVEVAARGRSRQA